MLGHEDPSLTLRAYADGFDSDSDALADILDQHPAAALRPSNAIGTNESEEKAYALRWCQAVTSWVGVAGFEPTASSSRTKRATKLRHTPLEAPTAYRTCPLPGQIAMGTSRPYAGALERRPSATSTSVAPGPAGNG